MASDISISKGTVRKHLWHLITFYNKMLVIEHSPKYLEIQQDLQDILTNFEKAMLKDKKEY